MMKRWSLLALAAALSVSQTVVAAQQPAAAEAAVAAEVKHPLFCSTAYPEWSAMTPAQALADTDAAVRIARSRLAAICALSPEQMTSENTFIAYGDAVAHLEQTQQYLHHL